MVRIDDIVVDSAGAVYVLDGLDPGVRVFDHNGKFIRRFGRRGKGPGEFTAPRVLALSKDTLIVQDQNRLVLFTTAGTYLDLVTFDVSIMSVQDMYPTSAGFFILLWERVPLAKTGDMLAVREVFTTAAKLGSPTIRLPVGELYDLGGVLAAAPLAPVPIIAVGIDGRSYSSKGENLTIEIRSPAGELEHTLFGDVRRMPASKQDIEDAIRHALQAAEGYGRPTQRNRRSRFPEARFRPALGAILVSEDHSILVQRVDLAQSWTNPDDPVPWQLIRSDWLPIGQFKLPRRFRPYVYHECALVGAERERDGIAVVVRYRFQSPDPSYCQTP